MLGRIKRANSIPRQNINPVFMDSEDLHFYVMSANNQNEYYVTCKGNLWRCDCTDHQTHGLHKEEGNFFCKHVIAVILYLSEKVEDNISEISDECELVA